MWEATKTGARFSPSEQDKNEGEVQFSGMARPSLTVACHDVGIYSSSHATDATLIRPRRESHFVTIEIECQENLRNACCILHRTKQIIPKPECKHSQTITSNSPAPQPRACTTVLPCITHCTALLIIDHISLGSPCYMRRSPQPTRTW